MSSQDESMVIDPPHTSGTLPTSNQLLPNTTPNDAGSSVTLSEGDMLIVEGRGNESGIQHNDSDGPQQKKQKLDFGTGDDQHGTSRKIEKLESRLVSLLSCSVCIEMPKAAIYQCTNGHLMCAGCFSHLLADARLRDEVATCPNCRIEINKHSATRNLAVEKAVNELPSQCQYCNLEFPRNTLSKHEREDCEERTMTCKYERIGCPWRGPFHELTDHQASCAHPSKTGEEVMGVLVRFDQTAVEERKLYSGLFDLLSYEKVHLADLQFKPYRTDEFVHKLYYETSRFSAFNYQWVVKARINDHQRDPTLSCERKITYQLILKSKPATATVDANFMILKGPFGDMKIKPQIHQFVFTETNMESGFFPLALKDSAECNRLLAAKTIHCRLLAFLQ